MQDTVDRDTAQRILGRLEPATVSELIALVQQYERQRQRMATVWTGALCTTLVACILGGAWWCLRSNSPDPLIGIKIMGFL